MIDGLVLVANTDYQPETGRFLTEDPIKDGLNWYIYALNNPVIFIDPSGCAIQLNGAKDEWNTLLGNLQMLTDHTLSYGQDGRVYISSYANKDSLKYENGNDLLIRMINNEYICKMQIWDVEGDLTVADGKDAVYATLKEAGKGSGSTIYFNPDFNATSPNFLSSSNSIIEQENPMHIILAHELVHADRMMRGVFIPMERQAIREYQIGIEQKNFLFFPYTSKIYASQKAPKEEFATIGLSYNGSYSDKISITENDIRKEQGWFLRGAY